MLVHLSVVARLVYRLPNSVRVVLSVFHVAEVRGHCCGGGVKIKLEYDVLLEFRYLTLYCKIQHLST